MARQVVYKGAGIKCDEIEITENSDPAPSTGAYYFFVGRLGLKSGGYCASKSRSQCETAMNALNDNPFVDPGTMPGMSCEGGFHEVCTSDSDGEGGYHKITFQSDAAVVQRVQTLSANEVLAKAAADEPSGGAKSEVTISEASKLISQGISGDTSDTAPAQIDVSVVATFDANSDGQLDLNELDALIKDVKTKQVGSASASSGSSTNDATAATSGSHHVVTRPLAVAVTFAVAAAAALW